MGLPPMLPGKCLNYFPFSTRKAMLISSTMILYASNKQGRSLKRKEKYSKLKELIFWKMINKKSEDLWNFWKNKEKKKIPKWRSNFRSSHSMNLCLFYSNMKYSFMKKMFTIFWKIIET